MKERRVDINTPSGAMETFIVHPSEGGPFPAVVLYMDVWGIREALRDIARRIARRKKARITAMRCRIAMCMTNRPPIAIGR